MAVDLESLAASVLAHAQENYTEGGWDVLVECWPSAAIVEHWRTMETEYGEVPPVTAQAAVASFATLVSIWADQQADARNSAF